MGSSNPAQREAFGQCGARAATFACALRLGHAGKHTDPSGVQWGDDAVPRSGQAALWARPQNTDQPRGQAPTETGRRLATFPRALRDGHATEELRIVLDEYEGHTYLGLRIWVEGKDGQWWPSRRGLTIRPAELVDAIKALVGAARELGLLPAARGSQS
jgi:hypothetical protein